MFDGDDWNWHVWKRVKGQPDKYVGFFFDTKDAFAWINKREGYVVNNVGPVAGGLWRQNTDAPTPVKATPKKVVAKPKPLCAPVPEPETAASRALKAEAKKVLAVAREDEARELEAADE